MTKYSRVLDAYEKDLATIKAKEASLPTEDAISKEENERIIMSAFDPSYKKSKKRGSSSRKAKNEAEDPYEDVVERELKGENSEIFKSFFDNQESRLKERAKNKL